MTLDHDLLLEIRGEVKAIREKMEHECTDHEERIRTLEAFQNRILGWASIIAALGGLVGSFLGGFLHKLLGG